MKPPLPLAHILSLFALFALCKPAIANDQVDLTELSIAELMEIEITSVSKKPQTLAKAAAAAFVITQEDIRRSGATTIPDLLRMVPGVQVARIDANQWAVSARGFNNRVSNKLLVLKDGRSIYTSFFSGVYWEQQDTPLENIERIEVIRGPGAALWGANAVNGVINIITKQAADTKGGLVSVGGGTSERDFSTVRYGFELNEESDMRLYAKYANRGPGQNADGSDAYDSWQSGSTGFRLDSQLTERNHFTLQGDYLSSANDESGYLAHLPTIGDPSYSSYVYAHTRMDNRNILGRWERQLSGSDGLSLQFYYDYYHADFIGEEEFHNTFDLDLQHHFRLGAMQDLIWGLGYRYLEDQIRGTPIFGTKKEHQENNLFSTFVHDELALVPDNLAFILGMRLEHNDYTGFELQPNARLIWTPTVQHSTWASVSRAVRTPSQGDRDLRNPQFQTLPPTEATSGLPVRISVEGNDNFRSETVIAYELGYRTTPVKSVSIDAAFFLNEYEKLRSLVSGSTYPEPENPPYTDLVQTYSAANTMHGHTYGFELSASWKPLDWWRLQAAYTYFRAIMHLDEDQGNPLPEMYRKNIENSAPKHQASLRTGFDLSRQFEVDFWLRAVDEIQYISGSRIPDYLTMDAKLAWKPSKAWELAIVGQNLLQPRHQEYQNDLIWNSASEVPRGVYGKLTWKF